MQDTQEFLNTLTILFVLAIATLILLDFFAGLVNLWIQLNKQKIKNEAITEYTETISLKTKLDKIAYFKRGVVYSKIEDYESAIEDYKRAIELDSQFFEAFLNLGNLLCKLNHWTLDKKRCVRG